MTFSPAFIPLRDIKPGVAYDDYVATGKGLVHKSRAMTSGTLASGNARWRRVKVEQKEPLDFGVTPNRRRTPAQRLASLTARIKAQYDEHGWSTSLEDELIALTWQNGTPKSREEIRELARHRLNPEGKPISLEDISRLAAHKLTEAEKEQEKRERKEVTRTSPYVLARP